MSVRMRVTINAQADRASELRTAADVRRDLWAHSPVEVDPDHPLHGTHRDEDGRAYFEFATEFPKEVRRVIEEYKYTDKVELTETPTLPGEECANCGNVAGPVRPTVCPNCQFRDITPCPICRRRSLEGVVYPHLRRPVPLSALQEPGAAPVQQPDVPS